MASKLAAPGRGPRDVALRAAGPAAVVAVWWLMSVSSTVASSVIPSPPSVLGALAGQLATGVLVEHVVASLGRSVLGYLAAAAVGVPVGLLMGVSPTARGVLAAPVELLRPVSSIAWIPLAILWFGIGVSSVAFVTFIVCVFLVLLNTLAGALSVDGDLLKAARTLGAGRRVLFQKVVVPSALPGILLGLRVALAGAWGGVVVTEMIASQNGIGYMIHHAQITFQPGLVIGGMLVIGLVGYGLNRAFLVLEQRLLPYARA